MSWRIKSFMDAGNKPHKRKLVVFFILSIGVSIVVLNSISSTWIIHSVKNNVNKLYTGNIDRLVSSNSTVIGNKMEGYLNSLNYYVYSDIAQTEDTAAISEWLTHQNGKRNPDFNYIVYGSPDFYWHQENGSEGKTNGVYFMQIMTGGKDEYIDDPKMSNSTHEMNIHVAKAVKKNGRTIGLFSGTMRTDEIAAYVNSLKIGSSGFAWVMDDEGNVVMHKNADWSMTKNYLTSKEKEDAPMMPAAKKIIAEKTGSTWVESAGNRTYLSYAPIPHTQWFLVYSLDSSDLTTISNSMSMVLVLSSLVTIALLLIINGFIIYKAIKPLQKVSTSIEEIASGNADLTRRLETHSNDEIGAVVEGFNNFTSKLQSIIQELKDSKVDLHNYGNKLSSMVQENANSLSQMLASMKEVDAEVNNQQNKVGSTVDSVNQISNAVETLRSLLQKQIEGVEQASAAVTQMIQSISSVTSSMNKMAGEFDVLQGNLNTGISQQHEVSIHIKQIEDQSKMLTEANSVISSIAEQTNLLAMNAAIEAAHAGEAGKGFAVVADEIRKLSENSGTQSKNIGMQLKDILEAIEGAVRAASQSDKVFATVAEKIKNTGSMVHQIEIAMDEQSSGSKQIGDALSYMNDATMQVRSASDEVDSARRHIIGDVESLKTSSDSVRSLVESMKGSVKHIEDDDDALLNVATSISGSIYRIGSQIDQFKV